jgi:hypothetical protein
MKNRPSLQMSGTPRQKGKGALPLFAPIIVLQISTLDARLISTISDLAT